MTKIKICLSLNSSIIEKINEKYNDLERITNEFPDFKHIESKSLFIETLIIAGFRHYGA